MYNYGEAKGNFVKIHSLLSNLNSIALRFVRNICVCVCEMNA